MGANMRKLKIYLLCLLILFVTVNLAGCSKMKNESDINEDKVEKRTDEGAHIEKSVKFKFEGDYLYKYYDNCLYYAFLKENQNNLKKISEIRKYDLINGVDSKLFDYIVDYNDEYGGLLNISVNVSGDLILFNSVYNDDYSYVVKYVYGVDGTEKSSTTLKNDKNESEDFYPEVCAEDSDGNDYVFMCNETQLGVILQKYSNESKLICSKVIENVCGVPFLDSQNKIVARIRYKTGFEYGYYDINTDSFDSDPFKILEDNKMSLDISSEYNGKYLLNDFRNLYSYDVQKKQLTPAIDYNNKELRGDCVKFIAETDDNKYFCLYAPNKMNAKTKLIIFE